MKLGVKFAIRYAFAVATVALTTAARWWLERHVGPMPLFITWYPAVLLVASVAGGGPGVLATLLSALVADFWFIAPMGFGIANENDAVAFGIFVGTGIFVSILAERLHRSRYAEAVSVTQERELSLLNMGNLAVLDMDHRIVRWSEGNRRLYGYDSQEVLGQKACDFLQTRFLLDHDQVHAELLEKGHWEGEATRRGKDGTQRSMALLWALRRDERGRPQAILEVSTDITPQKAAEEGLRQQSEELTEQNEELSRQGEELTQQSEELARSNKELEQFAYVSAHDLQEPLRQVRAYVGLLKDRHAGALEGKALQYFEFVSEGASRMSDLVQGLLEYSRAGARSTLRQPVACQKALDTALANLAVGIAEARAQVTHDDLPTVTAEPTQLAQLFQNLLGNAVKFRRQGVEPRMHFGCRRQGEDWLFSVQDNGIGIDAQYRDKIFMIFQRLHGREKYDGTGIGLAICKKIVEGHGGKIWVESVPGEGSTFYFTLPEGSAP